jgi:hypothetical protein
MSDPTYEPSSEPICKPTNDQTTNEVKPSSTSITSYTFEAVNGMSHIHIKYIVNNRADASQPTVAKTSDEDEVYNVINAHNKHIGTGRVTISDKQDSEIQSIRPNLSLPQPNEWQMPEQINLDSSGLQQSTRTEVLHWQDKVYSHSTLKKLKLSSKHAFWFSFLLLVQTAWN